MDDRLLKAARAGDGPRAPAFVGWCVVVGGALGATLGAWLTPWQALARAGFGLQGPPPLAEVLVPLPLSVALGVLLGGALGQLTQGRFVPALRWRVSRGTPPRSAGVSALLVAVAAGLAVPWLLARPGGRDPAALIWILPFAALGVVSLVGLPIALIDRARGRARWRERVAPDPPPRRDADQMPPEVRNAIAAASAPVVGDLVVWAGAYAVALSLAEPPRVLAHGGPRLVHQARAAGAPTVESEPLVTALAAVPTGDALPATLALAVSAQQ